MALQYAIDFINRFASDEAFRKLVFSQDGNEALADFLLRNELKFTYDEFEDAYRKLKLNCPDEIEAGRVEEVFQCYRMLLNQ